MSCDKIINIINIICPILCAVAQIKCAFKIANVQNDFTKRQEERDLKKIKEEIEKEYKLFLKENLKDFDYLFLCPIADKLYKEYEKDNNVKIFRRKIYNNFICLTETNKENIKNKYKINYNFKNIPDLYKNLENKIYKNLNKEDTKAIGDYRTQMLSNLSNDKILSKNYEEYYDEDWCRLRESIEKDLHEGIYEFSCFYRKSKKSAIELLIKLYDFLLSLFYDYNEEEYNIKELDINENLFVEDMYLYVLLEGALSKKRRIDNEK